MAQVRIFFLSLLAVLSIPAGAAVAQSTPGTFVSFAAFMSGVETADAASYLGADAAKVESAEAFEAMRSHILSLYDGVKPTNSFLLGSQFVDCVPILQQPTARALGLTAVATTPAPTRPASPAPGPIAISQLSLGLTDPFGNKISCDTGSIPMRRLTLENLSRFRTLQDFFSKPPSPRSSIVPPPGSSLPYRYEYTDLKVPNLGASAFFNVWYPTVKAGTFDHSLAELWVLSGGMGVLQSAETGWSVAPDTFGTSAAVLFTYWTADDYFHTGCYDLTCPGFVQTSSLTVLGTPFWSGPSQPGNQTPEFAWLSWQFINGNWWLQIENACAEPPNPSCMLGYIPGSIYGTGQLSRYSEDLEFGGEVSNSVLTQPWPPMGSGAYASAGNFYAAWIAGMSYLNLSGTAEVENGQPISYPSGPCYTIQCFASGMCQDFYFGGPGGNGC